jgi:hypothetical protein
MLGRSTPRDLDELTAVGEKLAEWGGVEAPTTLLWSRLRAADRAAPATEDAEPAMTGLPAPYPSEEFLARSHIEEPAVQALITEPHGGRGGIVALVGMSGTSKTSSAIQIARDPRVRRRFTDGVWWFDVRRTTTPLGCQLEILRVLGEPPPEFGARRPVAAAGPSRRAALPDRAGQPDRPRVDRGRGRRRPAQRAAGHDDRPRQPPRQDHGAGGRAVRPARRAGAAAPLLRRARGVRERRDGGNFRTLRCSSRGREITIQPVGNPASLVENCALPVNGNEAKSSRPDGSDGTWACSSCRCGTGGPKRVHGCLLRYFIPVSHRTVTTVASGPSRSANRRAAITLTPVDVPANSPSSRASRSTMATASSVET